MSSEAGSYSTTHKPRKLRIYCIYLDPGSRFPGCNPLCSAAGDLRSSATLFSGTRQIHRNSYNENGITGIGITWNNNDIHDSPEFGTSRFRSRCRNIVYPARAHLRSRSSIYFSGPRFPVSRLSSTYTLAKNTIRAAQLQYSSPLFCIEQRR